MINRLPLAVMLASVLLAARTARAVDDGTNIAIEPAETQEPAPDHRETEASTGTISGGGQSLEGPGIADPVKPAAPARPFNRTVAAAVSGGGVLGTSLGAPAGAEPPRNCAGSEPAFITRAGGKDELDMSLVTVVGGGAPGDVVDRAAWKPVAKLTVLYLGPNAAVLDFSKKDGDGSWPEVLIPGWNGGAIQYTLWIVVRSEGRWYTTGVFEYWRGDVPNGGNPSGYRRNGYYFTDMRQPAVGEKVGFFLTSGDQRRKDVHELKERTNVVVVPFPSDCGARFTFN